jgi:hypothetical protein
MKRIVLKFSSVSYNFIPIWFKWLFCVYVFIYILLSYRVSYIVFCLCVYIYCTILGYSIRSDHRLYRVTPLKTPFGLVIPFISIPITRNYIHSQFSITLLSVYTIIIFTRA